MSLDCESGFIRKGTEGSPESSGAVLGRLVAGVPAVTWVTARFLLALEWASSDEALGDPDPSEVLSISFSNCLLYTSPSPRD